MSHFFKDREDVARFVASRVRRLLRDCVLTITIEQGKSGDFYVSTVTDTSSVGTLMPSYSNGPQSTSK